MKRVIAVEGADGSGKSSIMKLIRTEVLARGLSCREVGRSEAQGTSPEEVFNITAMLQDKKYDWSGEADLCLRLAREFQRADFVRNLSEDVILLDRFVLSVLSRVRQIAGASDSYCPMLKKIIEVAGLTDTLFVDCQFEIAWQRVISRCEAGERTLSPKEKRGISYNRGLYQAMKLDFERGVITERTWLLDNSGTLESAERKSRELIEQLLLL